MGFSFRELDTSTWADFQTLFSKHGVPSSCWCMYYHRAQSHGREMREYRLAPADMPAHNRRKKKELVAQGRSHGILVYLDDHPVGWCSYGTKAEVPQIDRGRYYRKLGLKEEPGTLWRLTCFVVDRDYRKRGVASAALRAALASIKAQGGGTVEAYPVVSTKGGSASMWFGTMGMFEREGFKPVARLGASMLMRRVVH